MASIYPGQIWQRSIKLKSNQLMKVVSTDETHAVMLEGYELDGQYVSLDGQYQRKMKREWFKAPGWAVWRPREDSAPAVLD